MAGDRLISPDQRAEDETTGARYVRQLIGACNIDGGPMFHLASGNLGYQVEHHLYPDMPSTRYAEIAPKVREICERYELPYNTGPFLKQLAMVQRTILRLAFPGGKARPKPGPYRGELNKSAVKHENERSGLSREGYVPKWEQNARPTAGPDCGRVLRGAGARARERLLHRLGRLSRRGCRVVFVELRLELANLCDLRRELGVGDRSRVGELVGGLAQLAVRL